MISADLPEGSARDTAPRPVDFPGRSRYFRQVRERVELAGLSTISKLKFLIKHHLGRRASRVRTFRRVTGLLKSGGISAVFAKISSVIMSGANYARWVDAHDQLSPADFDAMREQMAEWKDPPTISVLMPVFDPVPAQLREAVESVIAQAYPHWELCIADDRSTSAEIRSLLGEYAEADARIKVVFRKENGHISRASNSALAMATGDWVTLLDHDDLLRPHSLYWLAQTILAEPGAKMIYSDEDKVSENGVRINPYFKSDWDPLLIYGHNMFSHLGAFDRELVNEVGGFRPGYEGAQDYDLVLRCIERIGAHQVVHIPKILYHWRTGEGSTASGSEEKPYAAGAAGRAINNHFERTGVQARVSAGPTAGSTRVQFELPEPAPRVCIIIPTRNGEKLLASCISSVLKKTDYANFEILVIDNGSDDPGALQYLKSLNARMDTRVLRFEGEFNYAAICNFAVDATGADMICLLNNDTEIITPEWLREMVALANQPGIGVVGCKLLYPDTTIQHAGIVLGMTGVAGSVYSGFPANAPGMMGRNLLVHQVSAVTAACWVVRRELYQKLGGLDARSLKVAYNDVDFCLRANAAGYQTAWTPNAVITHHESKSRGLDHDPEMKLQFEQEQEFIRSRWSGEIGCDRMYNPNLSLATTQGGYAFPPRENFLLRTDRTD